jgi:hypothetical protein
MVDYSYVKPQQTISQLCIIECGHAINWHAICCQLPGLYSLSFGMTIYIGTSNRLEEDRACGNHCILMNPIYLRGFSHPDPLVSVMDSDPDPSCIVSRQDSSDILPFLVSIFAELTMEACITDKQFTHSQTSETVCTL